MHVRIQVLLTAVLLALALGLTLLTAQASVQAVSTWQQQQTVVAADDPSSVGSWMTLPYIAQVYHVPENDLSHALHLQGVRQDQQTPLSGLALGSHRSVKALMIEVQVTIQIYRNFHPPQGAELLSSLLTWLVTWFEQSGYPILWIIVFLASVGAPLPVSLLLLAAGAFAALGDFHLGLLTCMTVSASVCGDSTGYVIGRRLGSKALDWIEQRSCSPAPSSRTIARSRAAFQRRGGWAVFLSRFLVSALGGTINLVAGTEHYPYQRFLLYDALGETIGALIPLALGYVFGASWEDLGDLLSTVSGFVLALLFTSFLLLRLLTLLQRLKALDSEPRDSFASSQLQSTQKETVTVR